MKSKRMEGIAAGETVDPQYLIPMKGGKAHPQFAGVLDLATRLGLMALKTRILQIPSEANGGLAVVAAIAEFEDGACFEDVGDASPRSTSPQMAAAALRLASTRAKGRVLRDSCNVGVQTAEEADEGLGSSEPRKGAGGPVRARERPPASQNGPPVCAYPECGVILSQGENAVSRKETGKGFCPHHLKRAQEALAHRLAANPAL